MFFYISLFDYVFNAYVLLELYIKTISVNLLYYKSVKMLTLKMKFKKKAKCLRT